MTGLFLAAGLATVLLLTASAGVGTGGGPRHWLLAHAPLLPGIAVAAAAVTVAGWLPVSGDPPRWLSSLGPVCVAAMFVLAVARYRRPGHSTSRRRR